MSRTRLMYSAGVPLLGGVDPLPFPQVDRNKQAVFFVDPQYGSDGNPGDDKEIPLQTWAKAHTLAPDRGGALVFGYPTADADEAITITKPYMKFINAGRSEWRCTIKSTAGVPLTIGLGADGFSAYGIQFRGRAALMAGCIVQADGFRFVDCDFTSDLYRGLRLKPAGANDGVGEGRIVGGFVRDCGGPGVTFENPLGIGPTTTTIEGVTFKQNTNEDILDVDAGLGNDNCFDQCEINSCRFASRNKAVYITLTNGGNNRGILDDCFFQKDNARLTNVMVALAAGISAGRIYDSTGLVDTSGF